MKQRDREALNTIIAVIDRALGFPIDDFDALEQTELSAGCADPLP